MERIKSNLAMSDAPANSAASAAQFRKFGIAVAVVTVLFALPLWHLVRFAIGNDLFSYIPLIPFVSLYLARQQTPELPRQSSPAPLFAALFFIAGALAMTIWLLFLRSNNPETIENSLALTTFAWLLFLAGVGCWTLGGAMMRALAFPFFLLLFMVPFPVFVRDSIESALQQGSATVADWMFAVSGMPYWRNGTQFGFSDITLEVAPECSGIHSTWILFITSLVAGYLILRRPWNRAILCLAVIPLALLRNGFRVFVIAELCVHVSPRMIDSPIHHHGGPIFFALSLVPFFLLVYFLRKMEKPAGQPKITGNQPGRAFEEKQ